MQENLNSQAVVTHPRVRTDLGFSERAVCPLPLNHLSSPQEQFNVHGKMV